MADDVNSVLDGFDDLYRAIQAGARSVVREHGQHVAELAKGYLTAKDTGQTRDGISSRMESEGAIEKATVAVWNVGYRRKGKNTGEPRPENLPLWIERGTRGVSKGAARRAKRRGVTLELGTRRTPPRPFLAPAAEADRASFNADLQAMVDSAVERLGR